MTEPEAMNNKSYSVWSSPRIRAHRPRWIGFSEDDESVIAEGADIRRQRRGFLQRVEESPRRPFHRCVSHVGEIPALRRQRSTALGFRH